jgi:hypothetical protein
MDTTERTLLVILSAFLALFLLLSIIAVIQVLLLLHKIRHVVEKAEKIVASAEVVGGVFRNAAGPLGIMRLIQSLAEVASHHKSDKKEKK